MAYPRGEVGDLHEALTALHALVGAPTDRQLESYASLADRELPRATANTVRRGHGTPRWETVEAFVAACLRFAKKHKPPIPIPAKYTDISLWRERWEAFAAAANAMHVNKAQNKIALAAQLPRSLNSPVRLLDPSNRVVEFIGRTAELDDLLAWCNDDSAGRLRLITGPGGIGKTRLALQLTRHLETLRWQCVWVADRHEVHILADIRAVNKGAVFLVVDYAETRIRLEELLRAVATDSGTVRVLLLARSAGQWWEQLALGEGAIRDLVAGAGPEGTRLGQVLDEHVKDEEEVLRAVPVFAAALGVPPPDHVIVEAQAGRARILELHAAALVAVLKWMEDPKDPKDEPLVRLSGILDELLMHEGHFWQGSARAQGLMDGPNGMTLRELRQVVAAGCLLGAANQDEAVDLLSRIPKVPPTVKVATWLRELYPPDHGSAEWLGAMQPDRLAERLVVSELSESEALTRACLNELGEQQSRRAILLLARAATEDDIAEQLLRRLLPLAARVVEDIDAPFETLVSIANAIPYPSMVLDSAHDVITRRILDAPDTNRHPAKRAQWLTMRGLTLTQLGRPWDALPAIKEAVSLYRELASVHPDRYQSELADALAHLGIGLSELGCPAEALQATQEAGRLYRKLASANPGRYLRNLAATLTNIGVRFSELRHSAEALQATQEAVRYYRKLAAGNPDRYQPDLAATLTNLGARWSELRCSSEALETTQEASRLYERLATANPDRYQPDYAATLANLGARFSELGQPVLGLSSTQKAISLLRDLASANPDRYRPNFAGFLAGLGGQFLDLGRFAEAMDAGQEALRLYRELARDNPSWYRPNLAITLTHLAKVFSALQRHGESLGAIREAADLYRELASANRDRYQPEFALSLMTLGGQLSELGRPAAALSVEQEAISLYRELANTNPERYRPDLALSLMTLGARLSELGRPAAALSVEQEAVSLYRGLASTNPEHYRPNLALALMIFGAQLSQSQRPAEALPPEQEAISLYRLQASVNPDEYLPKLAASLTNLGFRLAELNHSDEALRATREAVSLYRELTTAKTDLPTLAASPTSLEPRSANAGATNAPAPASQEKNNLYDTRQQAKRLYRELASANPEWDRPDLALSLINRSVEFSELGRPAEALSAVQESVHIYEELAADDLWYRPNLALARMILGDRFAELGRPAETLSAVQEATHLYRELAMAEPSRYRPILAESLKILGFKFEDLDRRDEALAATREAFNLYREQSIANLGFDRVTHTGPVTKIEVTPSDRDNSEALIAAEDAVQLYRALAAVNPDQHRAALARSLVNLEARLTEARRLNEARLIREEAARLHQELAANDSASVDQSNERTK